MLLNPLINKQTLKNGKPAQDGGNLDFKNELLKNENYKQL